MEKKARGEVKVGGVVIASAAGAVMTDLASGEVMLIGELSEEEIGRAILGRSLRGVAALEPLSAQRAR